MTTAILISLLELSAGFAFGVFIGRAWERRMFGAAARRIEAQQSAFHSEMMELQEKLVKHGIE